MGKLSLRKAEQRELICTALPGSPPRAIPPDQILQTMSAESESSEILQTVSGEFDQSPQQLICQTLSGKKETGKEYYNSLPVLFC